MFLKEQGICYKMAHTTIRSSQTPGIAIQSYVGEKASFLKGFGSKGLSSVWILVL